MAEKKELSEIVNPKRTAERRMEEAESDPKKGSDKGDLPGPGFNFFKGGEKKKDMEGLAAALKKRK